ncbi:hypothetical protein JW921_02100, partial [Candidatus Fermentibacterales bacterium]|nr:hypothetical protein [Candidatus Fermentibacterales bacterium]
MTGRASRSGPVALLVGVLLLAAGCAGPATGPIKGVLVVLPEGHEDEVAQAVRSSLQRYVTTTDTEEVFSWSFVDRSQF